MRKGNLIRRKAMLLGLVMLCSACSNDTQRLNSEPASAVMPSLPSSARQQKPAPECVPSCSAGLERLLDSMLLPPTTTE